MTGPCNPCSGANGGTCGSQTIAGPRILPRPPAHACSACTTYSSEARKHSPIPRRGVDEVPGTRHTDGPHLDSRGFRRLKGKGFCVIIERWTAMAIRKGVRLNGSIVIVLSSSSVIADSLQLGSTLQLSGEIITAQNEPWKEAESPSDGGAQSRPSVLWMRLTLSPRLSQARCGEIRPIRMCHRDSPPPFALR